MEGDDYIEDLITRFLKNMRTLAHKVITLTSNAIETTNIVVEDERKCKIIDKGNKIKFFSKKLKEYGASQQEINGVISYIISEGKDFNTMSKMLTSCEIDEGDMEQLFKDMYNVKETLRISQIVEELKGYRRASFNLDYEGYDWSKFFDKESDEPDKDKLFRKLLEGNVTLKRKYRRDAIYKFAKHTYEFIERIYKKELNFLISHSKILFTNSEYTERLSIIFEKEDENSEDYNSKYLLKQDIEQIWAFIHGCIRLGLMYCKREGLREFKWKDSNGNIIRTLPIDYETEAVRWKIALV